MVNPPRRVLITNDDGPPGAESPYVFGLFLELTQRLGWDVRVVLPSSQKSWIGKAFEIKSTVKGRYYYPRKPDGKGETSDVSRPLQEGEIAEWILLDATPATCTNIALYNLYPGEIDLVLSGPNLGRNTSSAFALSSGTIGAAMSGALAMTRAIAISYGTFVHPTPKSFHSPAHTLTVRIVKALWDDWGKDQDHNPDDGATVQHDGLRQGEVDLYNVNIPMTQALLSEAGMPVAWTRIWRNSYGQLFKLKTRKAEPNMPAEGPDTDKDLTVSNNSTDRARVSTSEEPPLTFHFAPQFGSLISPPIDSLPTGTDAWVIHHDQATVTPLRASFAEPGVGSLGLGSEWEELVRSNGRQSAGRIWKL